MISPFRSALRIRSGTPAPGQQDGLEAVPADKPAAGDNGLSKLTKLAPAEVLSVFAMGKTVPLFQHNPFWYGWAMVVVCFVWRLMTTHQEGKPMQWSAVVSSTVTFALWLCVSEGAAVTGPWFFQNIGVSGITFAAALWTLFGAPNVTKGD